MMANSKSQRKGSTVLEFVLVGIPVIFILISLFEAARGMWTYQSLSYSVREATRYASVHGYGCTSVQTSCKVNIGQLVTVIRSAGVGLDADTVTATFTPASGAATSNTLTNLAGNVTVFPPTGANAAGQNVKITLVYPFRTILAVFWAGAGAPLADSQVFHLGASSTEPIQY
jgi:TadE-like protein